jgi:multidrug efflux pump subunit AcrB
MKNSFRLTFSFLALSLLCTLCIPKLKLSFKPDKSFSELSISFDAAGSNPELNEQSATAVLENTLSGLRDLKNINSISTQDGGSITLRFQKNINFAEKRLEVQSLIRQIAPALPGAFSYPKISYRSDDPEQLNMPLLIFTLNGEGSDLDVKREAETKITKELASIFGVKEVTISGVGSEILSVQYDINKLKAFNLSVADISSSLSNVSSPTFIGAVSQNKHQVFVKLEHSSMSLDALRNIIVKSVGNYEVALKDVAEVHIEEASPQQYFRVNGKSAVNIVIVSLPEANQILLAEKINSVVSILKKKISTGSRLSKVYDDTVYLKDQIEKIYTRTSLAMLILLTFMLFAYREWRSSLNLFLSLFVNIAITILLIWIFKITLHIYSIAGLTIVFGIMIDHAIVMLDYYDHYKNKRVFKALLGATLISVCTLLLINLLPEEQQSDLKDFVAIIIIGLGSSLLTNMWFTTSLLNILKPIYKRKKQSCYLNLKRLRKFRNYYYTFIYKIARFKKSFVLSLILLFGIPIFLLPVRIEGSNIYNNSFGSNFYNENVRPILDPILGGSFRLFKLNVFDNSEFRDISNTKLFVNCDLPIGNTLSQMNQIISQIENLLKHKKGVGKYITKINSGQHASVEITFTERSQLSTIPLQLKNVLIQKANDLGGADWQIYGTGNGFESGLAENNPAYHIRMKGYNYDELKRQAIFLVNSLHEHKRVQNINIDDRIDFRQKASKEYQMSFDALKLMHFNVTTKELLSRLRELGDKRTLGVPLTINQRQYDVVLSERSLSNYQKWDILNGNTFVGNHRFLKIDQVGAIGLQETSGAIVKENRQYLRTISFDYLGSAVLGDEFLNSVIDKSRKHMPIGYDIELVNNNWTDSKMPIHYLYICLLILLINYLISAILFESFIIPLKIVAVIPISFIGLFSVFYLFGLPFDQGGYAAFVMLGSLTGNAAIYVMWDFKTLAPQDNSYLDCNRILIRAVFKRGRTIILSVVAAICGMMPFLFDGVNETFWFSLAVGTISGLLFSLFAIFIALPVLSWKM